MDQPDFTAIIEFLEEGAAECKAKIAAALPGPSTAFERGIEEGQRIAYEHVARLLRDGTWRHF